MGTVYEETGQQFEVSDEELTQLALAAGRVRRDWRSRVAISMAVGIVLINACGLCITNGFPEIPW